MGKPIILYHKDFARVGREFNRDTPEIDKLLREGWVRTSREMGHLEWVTGDPMLDYDEPEQIDK